MAKKLIPLTFVLALALMGQEQSTAPDGSVFTNVPLPIPATEYPQSMLATSRWLVIMTKDRVVSATTCKLYIVDRKSMTVQKTVTDNDLLAGRLCFPTPNGGNWIASHKIQGDRLYITSKNVTGFVEQSYILDMNTKNLEVYPLTVGKYSNLATINYGTVSVLINSATVVVPSSVGDLVYLTGTAKLAGGPGGVAGVFERSSRDGVIRELITTDAYTYFVDGPSETADGNVIWLDRMAYGSDVRVIRKINREKHSSVIIYKDGDVVPGIIGKPALPTGNDGIMYMSLYTSPTGWGAMRVQTIPDPDSRQVFETPFPMEGLTPVWTSILGFNSRTALLDGSLSMTIVDYLVSVRNGASTILVKTGQNLFGQVVTLDQGGHDIGTVDEDGNIFFFAFTQNGQWMLVKNSLTTTPPPPTKPTVTMSSTTPNPGQPAVVTWTATSSVELASATCTPETPIQFDAKSGTTGSFTITPTVDGTLCSATFTSPQGDVTASTTVVMSKPFFGAWSFVQDDGVNTPATELTPGLVYTDFGLNFSPDPTCSEPWQFPPFPMSQCGVGVEVNGVRAPIRHADGGSVTFQMPLNVNGDKATIRVIRVDGGNSSDPVTMRVRQRLFKSAVSVLQTQDGTRATSFKTGDTMQVTGDNLCSLRTGTITPLNFDFSASSLRLGGCRVLVGGVEAKLSFAWTNSMDGFSIVQFTVPDGLPEGTATIEVQSVTDYGGTEYFLISDSSSLMSVVVPNGR